MTQQPLKYLTLPYDTQSANHFSELHQLPYAIFLDSGVFDQNVDRTSTSSPPSIASLASIDSQATLDIMACDPYRLIIADKHQTRLITETETRITTIDPFTLTQQSLDLDLPLHNPDLPGPFKGGALGYFGYDAGQWVAPISYRDKSKQPATATAQSTGTKTDTRQETTAAVTVAPATAAETATTRTTNITTASNASRLPQPNLPVAVIGFYRCVIVTDHAKQQRWLIYHPSARQQAESLAQRIAKGSTHSTHATQQTPPFRLTSPFHETTPYADYVYAFNQLQSHLNAGDCYQANLTKQVWASFTGDPWTAYLALRENNPSPFSTYMHTPHGTILSLSPERFIHVAHSHITTQPIKGSAPRSPNPIQDAAYARALTQSAKDRAENLMIVDLMRNDLAKVCVPGSVAVPNPFTLVAFPHVYHLVSTITGTLAPPYTAIDALRACFPGGSITGAPKHRARMIIEALEPHRRSVYCGSIGYLSYDGTMDCNIAIRTFITSGEYVFGYSGGGIVYDSVVEHEYQEACFKLDKMLQVLNAL